MFALLILLSQKHDPSRNESYTLIKMCKCVGFFFWWMNSFAWSFSLLYFLGCGLSFSSLFFWHAMWACVIPSLGMHLYYYYIFLTCLLSMWHTFFGYASFISSSSSLFFIAHILDGQERKSHGMSWSFILWVDDSVCYVRGLVRDLDHDSMTSF